MPPVVIFFVIGNMVPLPNTCMHFSEGKILMSCAKQYFQIVCCVDFVKLAETDMARNSSDENLQLTAKPSFLQH